MTTMMVTMVMIITTMTIMMMLMTMSDLILDAEALPRIITTSAAHAREAGVP